MNFIKQIISTGGDWHAIYFCMCTSQDKHSEDGCVGFFAHRIAAWGLFVNENDPTEAHIDGIDPNQESSFEECSASVNFNCYHPGPISEGDKDIFGRANGKFHYSNLTGEHFRWKV